MRRTFCAAALAVMAWPASARADAIDRTTRTLSIGAGAAIRIDATIAELTIVGSNRPDVAIEITRHAPKSDDLKRFAPAIDVRGDDVRIAVTQLEDGRDPNFKSEIKISAPSGVVFDSIRVFEGHVHVTGLTRTCDVALQRGAIDADALAGRIRLETSLGDITVRDAMLTRGGMMRLRAFNGVVSVRFAQPPTDARILAVTFNGTLSSDIPLTMKDRFGPRFGETTIGSGDPVMSIDVVKGNIAIRVDRP